MATSKKTVIAVAAASLLLGIGVGAGVTVATTGDNTTASAPAVSPSEGAKAGSKVDINSAGGKNQAKAKATLDAFLNQVKTDIPGYEQAMADKPNDDAEALFTGSFQKSLAFLKQGSFTQQEANSTVSEFAQFYLFDKEAKIETEESDFVLSGDTAEISSGDFKFTINGTKAGTDPASGTSGKMSLSFENGEWKISGLTTGK